MPVVLAWIGAWIMEEAVALGASYAAAAIIGTAAEYAIVIGGSLAYSNYQKKRMAAAGAAGTPQMIQDSTYPRNLVYGKTRVSGTLAFISTTGTKNEYLHLILPLAGCLLTSIDTIYFGSDQVTLDGSGNFTGCIDNNGVSSSKYSGLGLVHKYLGTSSQAADATLIAASGGLWTSAHQLKGVAYLYVQLKFDQNSFSGGIPNITADVHGLAVYDPRSSTTAFSSNAALCIADYLNQPVLGLNVPYASMDSTELQSAANSCDDSIVLADMVTVINRYTLNGSIGSDTSPESILNNMASCMAGTLVYSSGVWFIQAGVHRTPSITFGEADLVGPISTSTRLSKRDGCNSTKGTYVEPLQQYSVIDFTPYENSTYITQDNNVVIWHDIQLPLVTSGPTCTRIAKIDTERARRELIVSIVTNLKGLQVRAGDSIYLNFARYGWVNQEFEVTEWNLTIKPTGSDATPVPMVAMTLRQIDSGVFTWANGAEGVYNFAGNTTLPNPFKVTNPTSLALSCSDSTSFLQPDGTWQPRLLASWTAPLDQYVLTGGKIEIQYKQSSSGTWLEWDRINGSLTSDYISDIQPGVNYDVQIRSVNGLGVAATTWVTVTGFSIPIKGTAPIVSSAGSLSSLGVTPSFQGAAFLFGCKVTWNPIVQPDLAYYEVKATLTNLDAATDYSWFPNDGNSTLKTPVGGQMFGCIYNAVLNAGYTRVRGVDKWGNAGPWLYMGNCNGAAAFGTGTISTQAQGSPNVTGLVVGNIGSGGSTQNAVAHGTTVINLTGGATSETHYIALSGFTAKPNDGHCECTSDLAVKVIYNYDDVSNSSTQAALQISRFDGAVLGAGNRRFSYNFIQ